MDSPLRGRGRMFHPTRGISSALSDEQGHDRHFLFLNMNCQVKPFGKKSLEHQSQLVFRNGTGRLRQYVIERRRQHPVRRGNLKSARTICPLEHHPQRYLPHGQCVRRELDRGPRTAGGVIDFDGSDIKGRRLLLHADRGHAKNCDRDHWAHTGFTPPTEAIDSMPPIPMVSTADEGTITTEPLSFMASYNIFMARRWSATGLF